MKTKFVVLFFLTFFLSFVIRFNRLTQNPEGFDQTEAAFGYNAYSVLKTGRDEYGTMLPLALTSIGDYKLSGYMYWQIPFIAIFGLSEFSTRLSVVTAGMISLFLIYSIVYEALGNRRLALLTLFFTGISPWHIILSRMAYDPMPAFMFYLSSVAFFVRWYKTERLSLLFMSSVGLSLGVATYYSVWVVFSFTVIFYWICIYMKRGRKTHFLHAAALYLLPFLIFTILLLITQGQRLNQDSTYNIHAYPLLAEQIREDQHEFPLFITRAFHNKAAFYPQIFLRNFFYNLSPDFLFLTGDGNDRRFFVPYHGVLYLWSAPFLLLGILYFWKNHSVYKNLLVLGPICIVFLGSSSSEFGSETQRTLIAAPFFCFLISYGLIAVARNIRNRRRGTFILGCIGLLLGLNMVYFNHQYYWHANVHQPWFRDFGVHEMVTSLPALEKKYTKIIIPDLTYIFVYFYNRTDPASTWPESKNLLDRGNFLLLRLRSKVGNYLTMPIECPAAGKLHVLYVCRGAKIPKNNKVINIIRYRDNQPAFIFLEFMPEESTEPSPENVQFMETYGLIEDTSDRYW